MAGQDRSKFERIYNAALEHRPERRAEFVRAECAGDDELRHEVESLLCYDGASLSPMDGPPRVGLPAGSRLGAYEILAPIGAGGMGEVYLAHDSRLDRRVAIKVLPEWLGGDSPMRERLRREAMAAAALDHPFICKVFEIGEHDGTLFMVMEYIHGETLWTKLRAGHIAPQEAIRIASQLADALELAHRQGFVHRDLKPANIMLTEQRHVKVMDFGLAKRAEARISQDDATRAVETPLTAIGAIVGTPDYMSPEQVRAQALDARSDLFSFGIILAEMLSGKHPFRKASPAETMSAVLEKQPDLSGDIPQAVMLLIQRLLAKAAADRYASISEVRSDLSRLAAGDAAQQREKAPTEERIPLIGRDAERQELLKHFDDALAGRGSLVMIGGEPGIGKTHLIKAILNEARSRGAYANIGHCYEMEGSPPYVPFIEMLEHTARVAPPQAFRRTLGDAAPEVAKLMPELRRMYSDIPPPLDLPPEQQRRFLFNAYREFIQRAAGTTPLVHVFEDLHWADEPTLLLLQHLAQAVATSPILMIGTYRDVELEVGRPFAKILENLVRQKLATRMSLRRLPVAGVEQMLAAMSGQTPPSSLARVVFEETEGNPFFVEEVFRHLVEEGKLFDEKGAFRSGLRMDQLQVPEGVRLVLGRRLERLSEEARRILATAAVIGRVFRLELLEELEKARPDAALEAVEEAEHAHLVETEAAGRQTRFRFVHELVRQTLSETLSLPRRQRLHARVADALERVYQSSIDAHVSALAHHLYQAGAAVDQEKAIHFLSEAAKRSSATAAHEEALGHLDNALSLLEMERSARAADLHARRAAVLRSVSRDREAIEENERALELFDSLGDHTRFVETCFLLHFIHARALQFQEMNAVADRAAQHAKDAPAASRCTVLAMQALSASATGGIDRALDLLAEIHEIAENQVPPAVIGLAARSEMWVRFQAAQFDLCEAAARRATRIFEQSGDVWSQAEVDMGLVLPPLYCGRPAEAERRIEEALPRTVRIGHGDAKYLILWNLVGVHIAKGDLASAERTARETLALAKSYQAGWIFLVETTLGGVLLYRDQITEALSLLTKAAGGPTTPFSGFPEGLLAFGLTAAGMVEASNARNAGMRWLPRPGTSRSTGAWQAAIAMTEALCLSDRREAGRLQVEAEKIAAEWDCGFSGFPVRTAAGIAAACAGNWTRAEEHHRAAIARMDAVPYITAQPIASYWYADMLAERGGPRDIEAAKAVLQESIAKSDAIGLALYARLARKRLAQIA